MSRGRKIRSADLFAGGGGASKGIVMATGQPPDVAINHDEHAIRMHRANHARTRHFQTSVFEVHPAKAIGRVSLDLLWASPDCTHFSRAKGGKPRSQRIRGLAWVVLEWATSVNPRVICVENVPEFVTWGPLHDCSCGVGATLEVKHASGCRYGKPIKERRGETFRQWVGALQLAGYQVEWRNLVAADYGAPTTRKRLFVIARRDRQPIRWPEPTHGPGRPRPWRAAAECIDWTIPCPSIFERKRPLAPATQRRVAAGLRRYVLEATDPYLVCLTHGGRLEDVREPLKTITAANRGERAVVVPQVATVDHQSTGDSAVRDPRDPLSTITTKARHLVVAPTLMANNTNNVPKSPDDPLGTITTGNRHYLVAPTLQASGWGERPGQAPRVLDIQAPLTSVVAGGSKQALVAAWLARNNGATADKMNPERPLSGPAGNVAIRDTYGLAAVYLDKMHGSARAGAPLHKPLPTVTAGGGRGGGHAALVTAFLRRHFPDAELGDEEGVHVNVGGYDHIITDIGLRMLQPRELARAQSFPDDYVLLGNKSQQIGCIGNSVPPVLVAAIVAAQFDLEPHWLQEVA